MKKFRRHAFGWFFILLGFVGLFLPILQGILFLIIGVIILAPEIPLFRKILDKLEKRYPAVFEQATSFLKRISARMERKKRRCAVDSQCNKIKDPESL